jgi:hypothetical protein
VVNADETLEGDAVPRRRRWYGVVGGFDMVVIASTGRVQGSRPTWSRLVKGGDEDHDDDGFHFGRRVSAEAGGSREAAVIVALSPPRGGATICWIASSLQHQIQCNIIHMLQRIQTPRELEEQPERATSSLLYNTLLHSTSELSSFPQSH